MVFSNNTNNNEAADTEARRCVVLFGVVSHPFHALLLSIMEAAHCHLPTRRPLLGPRIFVSKTPSSQQPLLLLQHWNIMEWNGVPPLSYPHAPLVFEIAGPSSLLDRMRVRAAASQGNSAKRASSCIILHPTNTNTTVAMMIRMIETKLSWSNFGCLACLISEPGAPGQDWHADIAFVALSPFQKILPLYWGERHCTRSGNTRGRISSSCRGEFPTQRCPASVLRSCRTTYQHASGENGHNNHTDWKV